MDERADALDRYEAPVGMTAPAVVVDAGGGTDTADLTGVEAGAATPETEEIRSEIEETRAQMSATIDAIQEKLNPQTIVEQVKDTVKETTADIMDHAKESVREATVGRVEHMVSNATDTARDTGSGIVEMVKSNPVPAALLGLGLGWFFLRNQNGSGNQGRYDSRQWAMPGPGASRYSPNNYATSPGPGERYRGAGTEYTGGGSYAPESAGYQGATNYQGGSNGSGGLIETIRQNPLPAAAAAVSLGWLLTRGGNNQPQPQHPNWDRYGYGSGQLRGGADGGVVAQAGEKLSNVAGAAGNKVGDVASAAGDTVGNVANAAGDLVGQAGNKVGNVASAAGDTVGNVASAAGDTVGNVASAAGDLVGQAGSKVGDVASTAGDLVGQAGSKVGATVGDVTVGVQQQAQRAQTQFQQMFTQNPLAIGAVAVALGAALGLAVPQTEQEQRLLGPARDNLVEKAQEVAQDTMQKVQQVTDQVQHTVQQTAQEQGLTV